ncbi:protein/nucleic acid deglycase DJ-1-like isoform X2 [Agrilus planipennis]|uniref:Protein/nucleic acid deglycase DJ-1-like isoform X2 n=1 Tax=Agrilus planipennis TaxID=224129 RepID=A0A1W4X8W9_AGRPL|nr:protein/nucleic acid deglycase DJ-1-like isoform X2 [Agrilus planipennis]
MPKRALVLLAEESEEMEAVTIIDILHRAGIEVEIVGIPENKTIRCNGGVVVHPTIDIQRARTRGPFDVIVLPGGLSGAKVLGKHREVGNILREQDNSGRIIAAGCAAPVFVLKAHGIGEVQIMWLLMETLRLVENPVWPLILH